MRLAVLVTIVVTVCGATPAAQQAQATGRIAGRVALPDGTPAPGAEVRALVVRDGVRQPVASTTVGWDGRYEISGVPAGDAFVLAIPSAALITSRAALRDPPLTPTLYPGVPQSEPGMPVAVYDRAATEGIDIWLAPAPQRYSVSGRVFWPDGASVDDIVIEYGGGTSVRGGIWTVNDPGGLFTIENASSGSLVLFARADSDRGPLLGVVSTTVGYAPVEEVRLVLESPGAIEGRVVFEREPPAAAWLGVEAVQTLLELSPLAPATEGPVSAEGRFRIASVLGQYRFEIRGLPDGWRVQEVRRNGTRVIGDRVTVPFEGLSGLELLVGPGGT